MHRLPLLLTLCVLSSLAPCQTLAQPVGEHVRCGFLVDSERIRVSKLGDGVQADRSRPELPEFYDSPSKRFRIHYTRTGPDAVPSDDGNANNIPDFVEHASASLEHSWETQILYGAKPEPPSDGMAGGSAALDVYLRDLSKAGSQGYGMYGLTVPDSLVIGQPQVPFPKFTSWLEVDNDFSPDDRNLFGQPVFATFGVEGLRVTCAHELHHVTQLISAGDPRVQLMVYELMASFMEMECYPELSDWQFQANRLFNSPEAFPLSEPSSSNGYPWGWFLRAFGEPNGPEGIVTCILTNIAAGMRPFSALVSAGVINDQPLENIFVNALPSMYSTGSRGEHNTMIPRAEDLSEISLFVDEAAQYPSALHAGSLAAFEVRAAHWSVPSLTGTSPVSTTVMFTWPDTTALVNSELQLRKNYTIVVTSDPGPSAIPIAGTSWGIEVTPSDLKAWVNNVATSRPIAPYPQPVVLSTSSRVFVPIANSLPGDKTTISLMNIQTVGITQQTPLVEVDGDRIVAPFEMPTSLAPGTYLLGVESDGRRELHKIVVKR